AERERACDEAVLRRGSDPRDYAEAIVNVCKWYVASPLSCVSGVSGADLRRRIEDIMCHRHGHQLTGIQRIALVATAAGVVSLPIVTGLLQAQDAGSRPQFEAVSIKLDKECFRRSAIAENAMSPGRLRLECMPTESAIRSAYVVYGGIAAGASANVPMEGA